MPLNLETLEALRAYQIEGDPDFLTELIDTYLTDAPTRILAMQTALDRQDLAAFAKAAHALKGSSGNLGAETLARICLQGEMAGRNQDLQQTQQAFLLIKDELASASRELNALRKA
jgi:HPt (histidine-containing phosphotransfer) domain-containing protein